MAKPDDGGPAFPTGEYIDGDSDRRGALVQGLSMRDWFAGRAMQGFMLGLAEHLVSDGDAANVAMAVNNTARLSYLVADAMLLERARG